MKKETMPRSEVLAAHVWSSHHKTEVDKSEVCGCFKCLALFRPSEVAEWCDAGLTALCPRCGIDAVLPSASGVSLKPEFLKEMQAYWFGPVK